MFKDKEILQHLEGLEFALTLVLSKLDTLILLSKKNLITRKEKKDV